MDWLYNPEEPLLATLASTIFLFLIVIVVTRIVGLRSFAKFTTFDFAFTVAVGSVVAATLTSATSITRAAIAIAALLLLTALIARLQRMFPVLDGAIANEPLLLMDGDRILEGNMQRARIQRSQLIAKLREANVLDLDQVLAVVLESTGDISVLHRGSQEEVALAEVLLEGVRRE